MVAPVAENGATGAGSQPVNPRFPAAGKPGLPGIEIAARFAL
jgi:hypothetical protein